MNQIKAPDDYSNCSHPWLFLAGSIEMDTADRWQDKALVALSAEIGTILNPRRDQWDSSWKQTADDSNFKQQVNWELDGLNQADIIGLYLDPATKSPISLLELGLFAGRYALIVCCPEGFWRKGNVDIVCKRYAVDLVPTFDSFIKRLRTRIHKWHE